MLTGGCWPAGNLTTLKNALGYFLTLLGNINIISGYFCYVLRNCCSPWFICLLMDGNKHCDAHHVKQNTSLFNAIFNTPIGSVFLQLCQKMRVSYILTGYLFSHQTVTQYNWTGLYRFSFSLLFLLFTKQ